MFDGFTQRRIETSGATISLRSGGSGPGLLLLHGYPQMHVMWHKIAPALAEHFTVVAADLRGYGDSSKPPTDDRHAPYSKRAMAQDMAEVMAALGIERFMVAGHDRGARVAHRLAQDHRDRVTRLAVLDIAPTHEMYSTTDKEFASAYYHWFFLIQKYDLPERMIGADPKYYLDHKLGHWGKDSAAFPDAVYAEYLRCFSNPETIHASCEDYRAAAGIDLEIDEADMAEKLECPVLALWGAKGFVGRKYDVLESWRKRARHVEGGPIPSGHFLAEEAPAETLAALLEFFRR
ncbi:alpha/beta fold hydrolase [Oceanibaculum pacificum]|uniref:Alpha/beta hydrolase n=1 Tax=Oceanibaculum pacificum TaxID=580166 RepID=A0A154VR52_9PROT|nr:alpha/beta hydrolase [Oceanibaculum pacificum]KZD03719.1 alpha/beta hydrolase [Oceanibaculum pacificum]